MGEAVLEMEEVSEKGGISVGPKLYLTPWGAVEYNLLLKVCTYSGRRDGLFNPVPASHCWRVQSWGVRHSLAGTPEPVTLHR